MSDSQPDEISPPPSEGRIDVLRVDRIVSRSVFFIGVGILTGVYLTSATHRIPLAAAVAFPAVFATAKLGILLVALRQRWPAWPAVLVEGLAVALAARAVWIHTRDPLYVIVIATLLLAAGIWRNRVAHSGPEDA